MYFEHAPDIWRDYRDLHAGAIVVNGIRKDVDSTANAAPYLLAAQQRLAAVGTESEFPEIQSWRRTFSTMGLKPTQYRCASESLLRRLRKEGNLPQIHPLIDICNAISVARAIPVAALDLDQIAEGLTVRYATGDERYQTFGGDIEHPDPREVTFVDAANQSHARRWTNRQSGLSAIQPTTSRVLIVTEAMHGSADSDVDALLRDLANEIEAIWSIPVSPARLSEAAPRIEF
ncbi:MAG: phenylalanine--tRNA ligase beta subunit-related protein [Thermomicrobiales bacterium]